MLDFNPSPLLLSPFPKGKGGDTLVYPPPPSGRGRIKEGEGKYY